MSHEKQMLQCATHGEAYATYICAHLYDQPRQEWFCDFPTKDNPWPDAWCAACDQAFLKHGEWNDGNSDVLDLRVICDGCYDLRIGSSVAPLMETRSAAWQPFVSDALEQLQDKQNVLFEQYDLSKHERWDWKQQTSEIVFSNAGNPSVIARIQFVGSISTVNDTWLWSWANYSLEPGTYGDLLSLREFGDTEDFFNLSVPKWPATEEDGWEMTAAAAKHLDAQGAYRTPSSTGFTFMLLSQIRRLR